MGDDEYRACVRQMRQQAQDRAMEALMDGLMCEEGQGDGLVVSDVEVRDASVLLRGLQHAQVRRARVVSGA